MSLAAVPVIYYIIVFSVFVVIGLVSHWRFRTGDWSGKKIRNILLLTLCVCMAVIGLLAVIFPKPVHIIRIAVLPIIDDSYNDNVAWIPWQIASRAGECIQQSVGEPYLAIPPQWIWMAVDEDSLAERTYLQSYAERISLKYALMSSIHYFPDYTVVKYTLLQSAEKNSLKTGQIKVANKKRYALGDSLAQILLTETGTSVKAAATRVDVRFIEYKSRAQVAMALRDFAGSIDFARMALAIDSADVSVRNLLAEAYLKESIRLKELGDTQNIYRLNALKICEDTILQLKHEDATTYRLIGRYYLIEKIWTKAEQHLKRAAELAPRDAEVYADLAYLNETRFKDFEIKDNEQLLRHAVFINPCFEEARLRLARWYYFRDYHKRARKEVMKLLAIHPRSIDGLFFLGKIAARFSRFKELTEIYDLILQLDPNNVLAYYNLGVYYFNIGDMDNAEHFFNRAVQLGNHLDSHLYLGQIYEQEGMIDKAIVEYRLRIRHKRGLDDPYVDVARERLYNLTRPDSSILEGLRLK